MITKKLTNEDIYALSRPLPDWDNIDPYSDLEETKSISSEAGEQTDNTTKVENKTLDLAEDVLSPNTEVLDHHTLSFTYNLRTRNKIHTDKNHKNEAHSKARLQCLLHKR